MSLIKKENITVVIGEYTDNNGQPKKQYRTIGELITMQGNDGPYQFGKIWGPHGATEFKVYPQDDRKQAPQGGAQQAQQPQQQFAQQQPQQQFAQQQPQPFGQQPPQFGNNNGFNGQ